MLGTKVENDMSRPPRKIGAQIANAHPAGVKNRMSSRFGRPSLVSRRPGMRFAAKNTA